MATAPRPTSDLARTAIGAAERFVEASTAIALGVFARDGEARWTNHGMDRLLAPRTAAGVRARLLGPRFERLAATEGRDPLFRGILHFGDLSGAAWSVRGEVRRLDEDLLIVAEHDVLGLWRVNADLASATSAIADLQRGLAQEKASLERALADLAAAQAMLVHAEKMSAIGALTAGVAHEILNPLAYVQSHVQSLGEMLRDVAPPALRVEADDVERGALDGLARIGRIVGGLRRFSRLDQAESQRTDLDECVRDAIAVAGPALRAAGVEVSIDLAGVPPVWCQPAELSQVFVNLVVNAAQAIEERRGAGHLRVRGRDEGERVAIDVEDDGPGMTPAILARIFEPFFTTKPVGRGTGLGLTVAHKIVSDRHGGTLTARSTPGVGTTFTVTLPKGPPA